MNYKLDIKQIAKIMSRNFYNDPLYLHLVVDDKYKLKVMENFFYTYINWLKMYSEINIVESYGGIVVVYDSQIVNSNLSIKINDIKYLLRHLLNWRLYLPKNKYNNIKKLKNMLSSSWVNEYVKGHYLHIDLVVVDKQMRGKGLFKKLMMPYLTRADKENLAITIETHNKNNVAIYEKYGFKLVNVIDSIYNNLKQYCLIRKPTKP